jgi:hypothetical protein
VSLRAETKEARVELQRAAPEAKTSDGGSDPGEPTLRVEVSFGNSANGGLPRAGRDTEKTQAVDVVSGARGTVLTLNTPGSWQGSANLTFKGGAPPMRFTLKLARVPNCNLSSLTLSSGSLALRVSNVTVGGGQTTAYFDARGKPQDSATGAAYTLKARRKSNGEVEVQVQRGRGAALGKTLTVGWQCNIQGAVIDSGSRGRPRVV